MGLSVRAIQLSGSSDILRYTVVGHERTLSILGFVTSQWDHISYFVSCFPAASPDSHRPELRIKFPSSRHSTEQHSKQTLPPHEASAAVPCVAPEHSCAAGAHVEQGTPRAGPASSATQHRAGPRSPPLLLPVHVEAADGGSVPHVVPARASHAI